jgi:hypothetical protein
MTSYKNKSIQDLTNAVQKSTGIGLDLSHVYPTSGSAMMPIKMSAPQFKDDSNWTYVVQTTEDPQNFTTDIIVLRKSLNPAQPFQVEIGRVTIDNLSMIEMKSAGKRQEFMDNYSEQIVKQYEAEKSAEQALMKSVEIDPEFDALPAATKIYAAKMIQAELAGELAALGINVSGSLPTGPVQMIVKKNAQLVQAQMEGRPESEIKYLALELASLKESFKETATKVKQEEYKNVYKPIGKPYVPKPYVPKPYVPLIAPKPFFAGDWDDEDVFESPVKMNADSHLPKQWKSKRVPVSAFAEDGGRKFRDD